MNFWLNIELQTILRWCGMLVKVFQVGLEGFGFKSINDITRTSIYKNIYVHFYFSTSIVIVWSKVDAIIKTSVHLSLCRMLPMALCVEKASDLIMWAMDATRRASNSVGSVSNSAGHVSITYERAANVLTTQGDAWQTQLGMLQTQLGVFLMQLNVNEHCYVIGQTQKSAIVCDLKIVLASPKIALYEKGA